MNSKKKQLQLLTHLKKYKIDVALLQEHNIRKENVICNEILDEYHVEINFSISLKGGTAIMINRRLPYKIISVEKAESSRITTLKLRIYDQIFKFINHICSFRWWKGKRKIICKWSTVLCKEFP